MKNLSLTLAVLGASAGLVAQNCNTAPAAQVFSNRQDFAASFYYNLGSHIFDLDVQVPITISGMRTWLYDQGVGNPVVPDQRGNTSIVDVYICPTTRLGNENSGPATPNSPWILLGSGSMIVADVNVGDGESRVVFNPPLNLAAGQWGVNVVYNAPTTGLNPGPLHCLGVSPNPGGPYRDAFLSMSADGIIGTAWAGVGVDSPNLRIAYTPAASAAQYLPFGEGCYFRPFAFYQNFPNSAAAPSLANTSISLLNIGPNYLAVPGGLSFVPPTGTSLTAGPYGSSSSLDWDDALSSPITLPFTFNYPGGSTTEITISSNGSIYLDAVINNTYAICGASYGSIAPFREGPPRIAAFYHDLDPSVGGAGLFYEVDPGNQFVRVTWQNVQEWGVATAVNTFQVTLWAAGNIDLFYGSLANRSAGNNAIAGFTPGLGSRLPAPINLIASLPFQTGDGAVPPLLTMDGRPVIGTTANLVTTNVTPGTLFEVFVAGFSAQPSPTSLAPFGMPGCFQHINPFSAFLTGLTGNDFVVPFTVPNNPTFQNVQFFFQAAPLTPGLNGAGILTSNGLCVKIGT